MPTDIQVTVENGWVTLTGVVNWEFQQRAATDSVRFLAGVKGVSNNITLKPTAQPSAVKDAIEKALVRNAEIDAGNVKVAADGGTVTLVRQRPVVGRERPGRDGRLERPGRQQRAKRHCGRLRRDGRIGQHTVGRPAVSPRIRTIGANSDPFP